MDRPRLRALPLIAVGLALVVATPVSAAAALPLRNKSCGAVVTSSFRLKNDLDCHGDGLRVGAAGIVIDLNGKTIEGDGDAGDRGVDDSGFDDVEIRNGTIDDFDDGVKVHGASRVTLRHLVSLVNSGDGVDVDGGKGHLLVRVRSVGNTGSGIEFKGRHGTLRRNATLDNIDEGLALQADASLIVHNASKGNGGLGLHLGGNDNVIRDNVFCGNDGLGEFGITGSGNDVSGNDGQETCPP